MSEAIERIERLNPRVNAVVTPMFDLARSSWSAAPGPFKGVPFLLQDLLRFALASLTLAARLKNFNPTMTASWCAATSRPVWVILGKTNTPEFGHRGLYRPELFGRPVNP